MKSTITCDMEGVIETFNDGAEKMFGYTREEIIGRKRVSLFSPGLVVLQNVAGWLKESREKGDMRTRTVFIRKDGSKFSAEIRITPTFRDGVQIGYCGITEELKETVTPHIKWYTLMVKWLVILRAPFLSASIIPAFIAAAYASGTAISSTPFPTFNFVLAVLGVMMLHLASNVYNDYFDWTSGTDPENNNYFLQYSGGSRAIELGLISEKGTAVVASALLVASTLIGVYLWMQVGVGVVVFGIAGAFLGYFYTAPPVRLVARHGLGELAIGMAFGPLLTGGVYYVLTGHYSMMALLIGWPIGLLTANILLINQVPDKDSDARTGKNHLVVTFGEEKAVAIYGFIAFMALVVTLSLAVQLAKPGLWIAAAILGAMGAWITLYFKQHVRSRSLVKANVRTIYLAVVFGVAFALGVW